MDTNGHKYMGQRHKAEYITSVEHINVDLEEFLQDKRVSIINWRLNHKNFSSSQDPPSPDMGLVMGLLLSSPRLFLPACLLPPSHCPPSPLPQMA